MRLAASAKADLRLAAAIRAAGAEIVHTHVGRFQENLAVRGSARVEKIRDDFILRINGDGAAAGELLEVDAMGAAAEAQPDAVMGEALRA